MATYKKITVNKKLEIAKDLFDKLKNHGITFEIFESGNITSWSKSDGYSMEIAMRSTPPEKIIRLGDNWPIDYMISEMGSLLSHIHGYEKWLDEKKIDNQFLDFVKSNL